MFFARPGKLTSRVPHKAPGRSISWRSNPNLLTIRPSNRCPSVAQSKGSVHRVPERRPIAPYFGASITVDNFLS